MNRMMKTALVMPMISVMTIAAISAEAAQKRAPVKRPPPRATTPIAPPTPAPPAPPAAPYALRGMQLGMTLDQWRMSPIIADGDETDLRRYCTDTPRPSGYYLRGVDDADTADGIVSCQWFGTRMLTSELYIDIGKGKGPPVFQFINDASGTPRLFRIAVFANSTYAADILDALTRNYGTPKVTIRPFQTNGGATFDQTTSVWDSGSSSITMVEPCRRTERYCLTYRHAELGKLYDALVEKRAAKAAGKI